MKAAKQLRRVVYCLISVTGLQHQQSDHSSEPRVKPGSYGVILKDDVPCYRTIQIVISTN